MGYIGKGVGHMGIQGWGIRGAQGGVHAAQGYKGPVQWAPHSVIRINGEKKLWQSSFESNQSTRYTACNELQKPINREASYT